MYRFVTNAYVDFHRWWSVAFLVSLAVACDSGPSAPTGAAPVRWARFENERLAVELPGPAEVSRAPATGADTVVAQGEDGSVVSLCLVPATAFSILDGHLGRGEVESAVPYMRSMFPALAKMDVKLAPDPHRPGTMMLTAPVQIGGRPCAGRIWREPESFQDVFLMVTASDAPAVSTVSERVVGSLKVKVVPPYPPDRPARSMEADVPADLELTVDDFKKRYWARPDGRAFFMLSKGTANPFAESQPGYGATADGARMALVTAESLSGHKPVVRDSRAIFSDGLFVPISRATGTVSYKAGDFLVEMDLWYDPRLKKMTRVYIGGLTPDDLKQAAGIRETLRFEE